MNDDQFWLLMSRRLSGEITEEEDQKLRQLLDSSEQYRLRFQVFSEHWNKSKDHSSSNAVKAYHKVLRQMEFPPEVGRETPAGSERSLRQFWIIGIAAATVGLLVACVYLFSLTDTFESGMASRIKKQNRRGEHSKIVLPDGSFVWLNTESELEYPDKFASGVREVHLKGEAFFEVTKNPDRPFIIRLGSGTIRVLGTSFNVRDFANDANIETSVVTGRVAFIPAKTRPDSHADTIILTPNEKVIYSKRSYAVVKESINSLDDRAWVDGQIIFKSTPFEEAGRVLERTYAKHVVFKNEDLKRCELTAKFDNNSLEEIMEMLAETKDYKYTITRDSLVISGTGCSGN